jgi:hypothetical protein
MIRRTRLVGSAFSLILLAATLPGCSDDGLGKRYKVTGKVTYNGAPVDHGLICFISGDQAAGRSCTGTIDKGYYTLQTQEPGDGAFPGDYSVTVTSKTPDMEAAATKAKQKGNTAAYTPPDFTVAAYKKAPDEVPKKYGIVSTENPLKAKVEAKSNEINFELKD